MEEKLLRIFKLADLLNEKQSEVYAQIIYTSNDNKTIEIIIRSKKDFSYIEKCEINLKENILERLDGLIKIFESYIGGATHE